MQRQLITVCRDNKQMAAKVENQQVSSVLQCQLKKVVKNADSLGCYIHELESNLSTLRCELLSLKKEKEAASACSEPAGKSKCPASNLAEKDNGRKLKCLQDQYASLQTEYCRKEKESKDLADRLFLYMNACNDNKEKAENLALKNRASELEAEITDYKVFIKEVQDQVDTYREKFMKGKSSKI